MSNIIKPDPYISQYVYEKSVDPDAPIVLRSYERRLVDAVDRIVELAHGQRDYVKTESDWKVVEELFAFFVSEWPKEYQEFREAIPQIKEAKGEGYSQSREIQHIGSMPPRFMKMMRAIFPYQEWDKKFISKFLKRFPLFKVGEKQK